MHVSFMPRDVTKAEKEIKAYASRKFTQWPVKGLRRRALTTLLTTKKPGNRKSFQEERLRTNWSFIRET